jgi:hypothetical protein
VIGTIMIVSTRIAGKRPDGLGAPPKNGTKPKALASAGSTCRATHGAITRIPQRPTTTLGTAASISISVPTGPRIARGASSERKSPIAIESGVARITAANEVISVPRTNWSAPNWFVTGFHSLVQRNEKPKCRIEGQAPSTTFHAIAATRSAAAIAAAAVRP